jgi:hypothetical protein
MNQTSEWICKLTSLQEFTRAEQSDLTATMDELDGIEQVRGEEYEALQYDLESLINCY